VPSLQDYFCLNRQNFQINPKQSFEDAKLYFGGGGRDKTIIRDIELGYMAGYVPRVYLFGNYGTGKTHLLYHLKHYFESGESEYNVIPVVVSIEAETKTRYQALHKRILDAITVDRVVEVYSVYRSAGPDADKRVSEIFPNPNTVIALQLLIGGNVTRGLGWRWLTGDRVPPSELSQWGFTSSLVETGDLVELLVGIGELFKRTGSNLLVLIDEAEGLHYVTQEDARRSWHDAFHRLADQQDNQSIGWICAFYSAMHQQAPEFMVEGDIVTRLGKGGIVQLDPLSTGVEVRSFVADMLAAFVDHQCASDVVGAHPSPEPVGIDTYPFTEGGLEAFVGHAADVAENALPRTILRAITTCAMQAAHDEARFIDRKRVDDIVPAEFAEQV
jgi:hypothetical protein